MKIYFLRVFVAALLSVLAVGLSGCAPSQAATRAKAAAATDPAENAVCLKRGCECTKKGRCVPEMFDECKCL